MDLQEQSSSHHHPPAGSNESSPSPSAAKNQKRSRWKFLGSNVSIGTMAVVTIVVLYAFVHRVFLELPVDPGIIVAGRVHIIQLNVLNGTDASRLAQRTTDYLRARGFDVVEMGNSSIKNVEFTRVIDRAGNLEAAHQVAEALGVSIERVSQELDPTLYLDVSVIVGNDFEKLRPFQ